MDDLRMGMVVDMRGSAETEVLRALCGGQRIIHAGDGGNRRSETWRNGVLFFDPGNAGPRRSRLPVSFASPQVSGKMFEVTVPGTSTGSGTAQEVRREEGGRGPAWVCSRSGHGKTACQ